MRGKRTALNAARERAASGQKKGVSARSAAGNSARSSESGEDIPFSFETTADISVPKGMVDQVIGQQEAVEVIKKAAKQKRHVLLIGRPGTGKSMLGQAMAELLPVQELQDTLIFENQDDENVPKVLSVPAGKGKEIVKEEREKRSMPAGGINIFFLLLMFVSTIYILYFAQDQFSDVIRAAMLIGVLVMGAAMLFAVQLTRQRAFEHDNVKIVVENTGKKTSPFIDATGAKAGALLGDVKHDPLQSGGLGTPAHLRVAAGFVHKANGGVLFIDETSSLKPQTQQELLTAMQEKKYAITGQSEMSSGALVHTEPVPCDFVLIAAGNMEDLRNMHPALRSRIRGYGYEVYMNMTMEDSPANRGKVAQFVAQEIVKDGKIPHFSREAVEEIVRQARKMAGRKGKLTVQMRELGGLVRAAGDIAKEQGSKFVSLAQVKEAEKVAHTLEQQVAQQMIDVKKDYRVFLVEGSKVAQVNGLAVIGNSGIILPIVAEVAPSSSRSEGRLFATGKLGEIAKEAIENVSAIIKKFVGKNIAQYDIHIQFLQAYEGVEGDSASVSVATAVISALEGIPLRQDTAMTGSLSVRGEVLPIGGVTQKIEAAIEAGVKRVIIPKSNYSDIVLSPDQRSRIEIVPVAHLREVLESIMVSGSGKTRLLAKLKANNGFS